MVVPDNFFERIAKDNERPKKYGAKPVKPIDRIKSSFKVAIAGYKQALAGQTNAKKSVATKEAMSTDETDSAAEE